MVVAFALAWLPGCRCGAPAGDAPTTAAAEPGTPAAGGPEAGHSLRFDGVDDHLSVAAVPGLDGDGVTLEAWVRPGGPEVPRANILACRDPGGGGDTFLFRIREDMGGVLEFGLGSAAGEWGMAGQTRIPRDRWTHVAATHDRPTGTIRLYVDGALDAEARSPVPPLLGELPLWIGGDPLRGAHARPFAGHLDDIRIWDHVREPAQLAETRSLPLRGDEPGLVLLLTLDEGLGGRTADGAGHGLEAVLGSEAGDDPSDPAWSDEIPP